MPIPPNDAPIEPAEGGLKEAVLRRITDAILDGVLASGEIISEVDLARWLGVSRTPVREAVNRLVTLGLLEVSASRFTRVTRIDEESEKQSLQFVGYQTGLAIRLAVPRMTEGERMAAAAIVSDVLSAVEARDAEALYRATYAFVAEMTAKSGNVVFERMMSEVGSSLVRNLRSSTALLLSVGEERRWFAVLSDAIRSGDSELAEMAFRSQMQLSVPSSLDSLMPSDVE